MRNENEILNELVEAMASGATEFTITREENELIKNLNTIIDSNLLEGKTLKDFYGLDIKIEG